MSVLTLLALLANTVHASGTAIAAAMERSPSCGAVPCTCTPPPTVADARARARDVVLGEPIAQRDTTIEVARSGDRVWTAPAVIVTLRVHARWKGPTRDTVEVVTLREPSMCGVPLVRGERYVLFSEGTSPLPHVSRCSRTAREREAAATLRALGPPALED